MSRAWGLGRVHRDGGGGRDSSNCAGGLGVRYASNRDGGGGGRDASNRSSCIVIAVM